MISDAAIQITNPVTEMLDVLVAELKTLLNNVLMVFSYSNFLISISCLCRGSLSSVITFTPKYLAFFFLGYA
jgi:hypothetical protein